MNTTGWTIKAHIKDYRYKLGVVVSDEDDNIVGALDMRVMGSQGPIDKELLKFVRDRLEGANKVKFHREYLQTHTEEKKKMTEEFFYNMISVSTWILCGIILYKVGEK